MISDVNESRAEKVRAHRRNPIVIDRLKARIVAGVLRDETGKTIAADNEISWSKSCRWIRALGYRLMYVSDEERAHLMERRKSA